jgi:tape measure domain-containing protein
MPDRIDNLVDQQKIDAQFAHLNKLIDALVKRITNLNMLAGQFNLGGSGGRGGNGGSGGGGRSTSNQARTELEQLIAAQERLSRSTTAAAQLIAQYNYQTNQQNLANRRAAAAATNHADSLNGMRARLAQLTTQYDQYSRAQRRSREEGRQTLTQIQQLQREIRALEQATGRSQRNVGNYPKQLVGGVTSFLGAFGITAGVAGLAAASKQAFDTTVQLDSLNAALKLVSKTDAEYAENQKYLLGLSERLGLNIIDLTKAYKLFYAASTQAGLSAFATRKIFTSVAEVSANLKLSQEDTNGVLLAFSQILGKGKVQAEELRGQIGERLPGAFSIAARSIGVTEQELNKMLQKGEVIASEFLPKFAAELEKTFGRETEDKVEGLQASINRLSNEFTNVISNNQSGLNKFFAFIIDGFSGAIKLVDVFIARLSNIQPSDYRSEVLSTIAKEGRQYNGNIGPIKLFDNVGPEGFKKRYDAALNAAKASNDAYLSDFAQTSKKEQDILINGIRQSFIEARQLRNELAKTDKRSPAFFEADLTFQREADRYIRARRIMQDRSIVPSTIKTGPTEKELNAAARLREREIKAETEAAKAELQIQIERQKAIIDNEEASFAARMSASEEYYRLKNELVQAEAEGEKKRITVEIGRNRASAKEIETVDKKSNREIEKNKEELGKNVFKIIRDNADEQVRLIIASGEAQKEYLREQAISELKASEDLYQRGLITKEQYESESLRISNKYDILELYSELDTQKKILEILKQTGVPVEEQENRLLEIRNKIREKDLENTRNVEKAKTEAAKKENEKRAQYEKEFNDKLKELREEVVASAFTIAGSFFDREKNKIQDQIDQIEQRKEAEINAINASSKSEEEKAHAIALLNSQTDAQRESLQRRQRQYDQQKARFDKAKTITEIIGNTAAGVTRALRDYGPVAGAALATVVGAIGAAQLAAVIAQPIPRYRDGAGVKGRPSHKGGLAQVNDGGKLEVLESPGGDAYVAQGMNAIVDMPAGYKVHPSISDYYAATYANTFKPIPVIDSGEKVANQIVGLIAAQYKQQTSHLVSAIKDNRSIMIVKNTWSGLRTSEKHASGIRQYLNRNVFRNGERL